MIKPQCQIVVKCNGEPWHRFVRMGDQALWKCKWCEFTTSQYPFSWRVYTDPHPTAPRVSRSSSDEGTGLAEGFIYAPYPPSEL